jgi:hypothetical protein
MKSPVFMLTHSDEKTYMLKPFVSKLRLKPMQEETKYGGDGSRTNANPGAGLLRA